MTAQQGDDQEPTRGPRREAVREGAGLRPVPTEFYHRWPPFDLGGHLRRLRRRLDLSQRELAAHLHVGQSRIADWETGRRSMTFRQFDAVCELAAWHVVVFDPEGEAIYPMEAAGMARDFAGRLFPAHLDVEIHDPDAMPWRPDVRLPDAGAPRRARRDAIRIADGVVQPHPSAEDVLMRIDLRRAAKRAARWKRSAELRRTTRSEPLEVCFCPITCEETQVCAPECPCQCSPAVGGPYTRAG